MPGVVVVREWRRLGALGGQVHALVHPVARADARRTDHHAWFIGSRLAIGAMGLAAVPVALAVHNGLVGIALAVVLGLAAQAGFALWASRSGDLVAPHRASVLVLAFVLGWMEVHGGDVWTPLLAVLPVLMVESVVLGGRSALSFSAGVTLAAFAGVGVFAGLGGANLPETARVFMQETMLLAASVGVGLFVERETRRREFSETALEARERLVNEGFGDLVTRHDAQGAVITAGPNAPAVLGVGGPRLEGRGLFERVHVADRPAYLTALADAGTPPGRAVSAVLRLRIGEIDPARPAAPAFGWFEMRARGLPTNAGGDARVVCLLRDVTAERNQHDDIDRARRNAESANALKSRFLAMVSHELRTPLNAIIGFSDMLAGNLPRPLDEERRRDYARIVRDSGQHLLGVVNTLLDISQIESGTFPLDPEPVDLREIVHAVSEMLRLRAEAGSVALVLRLPPDLPQIVADRRACRQIMVNLMSNAVKFTPPGGTVTVECRRDVEGVVVSVSDTGIGVAAEDLARLGEPFFQVRSGHDRPFEGTGLGLSVVRGLVGLHGGTMSFESRPQDGLRVVVKLAARTAPQETAPVVAAFPSPAQAGPPAASVPAPAAGSLVPAPSDLEPTVKKRA